MCKYCKDILRDGEFTQSKITEKTIKFGKNFKMYMNVDIWVPDSTHDGELSPVLEFNLNGGDYDEFIFDERISIKYCPFCGTKLPLHMKDTKQGWD